jgi:hypothetical protein
MQRFYEATLGICVMKLPDLREERPTLSPDLVFILGKFCAVFLVGEWLKLKYPTLTE